MMSFLLVDYLLGAELLVLLVLHIAQQEDEVAALAWLQGNLDIMRCDKMCIRDSLIIIGVQLQIRLLAVCLESDEMQQIVVKGKIGRAHV